MISLSAVETAVKAALEDTDTALMAVSIPDSRKGERIVLLSETALDAKTVKATMLANGTPPMMIPSHWFTVETIPHLGSGKADFAGAKRLAKELIEEELKH
jgi:acyl-[acyl-carrier-protein]-phospholipid O-acyltransferase/long-chain-fatty-acid--[acyl-carrier-protein] ligase